MPTAIRPGEKSIEVSFSIDEGSYRRLLHMARDRRKSVPDVMRRLVWTLLRKSAFLETGDSAADTAAH